MKNCNMPNCNMSRYDMTRGMNNDMPCHMSGDMNRYMRESGNSCECGHDCDAYPIAMGYVPWQEFKDLHDPDRGLHAGTIFMELEKPFTGRRPYRR